MKKTENKMTLGRALRANNPNIKLENVGFIVEVMLDGESTSYLALSNKNGYVKEVKGTVTINNQNIATDTEYKLEYVSDKSKATTFLTGDKGILTINNLAVYKKGVNEQYSYTLIETSNSNYGYIVSSQEISNIKLAKGTKYKAVGLSYVDDASDLAERIKKY